MEIALSMAFGLTFRYVLHAAQNPAYPLLLGVWEGACLRYLTSSTPDSLDPYLAYGLRLCVDFLLTRNVALLLTSAFWAFLSMVASEALRPVHEDPGTRPKRGHSTHPSGIGTGYTTIHTIATTGLRMSAQPEPIQTSTPLNPNYSSIIAPDASSRVANGPVSFREEPAVRAIINPIPVPPTISISASRPSEPDPPTITRAPPENESDYRILSIQDESALVESPHLLRSYTMPHPTLVREQSPQIPMIPLQLPRSISDLGEASPSNEDEVEHVPIYSDHDELQTPLQRGIETVHVSDNSGDELSTPLAIPLNISTFVSEDAAVLEPPPFEIGPSLLNPSTSTHALSNVSPIPIPAPIHSTLLDSPLSALGSLSAGSSSPANAESIISSNEPSVLYARADTLRKQAWKEDRAKTQLELDLADARNKGKKKEVFMLLGEIQDCKTRIDNLHARARRRYYHARNKAGQNVFQVDVHGLLVPEAVEATEHAFREVLKNGGSQLRVIVGKGNHSRDGVPKLRPAIIKAMNKLSGTTAQIESGIDSFLTGTDSNATLISITLGS